MQVIKSFESIKEHLAPLAKRYEDVLVSINEATKDSRNATSVATKGALLLGCLGIVCFFSFIILSILHVFAGDGGIVELLLDGLNVLADQYMLIFGLVAIGGVVYIKSKSKGNEVLEEKNQNAIFKNEVIIPFITLLTGQKASHQMRGRLLEEEFEAEIRPSFSLSTRLHDLISARVGEVDVTFGEHSYFVLDKESKAYENYRKKGGGRSQKAPRRKVHELLVKCDFHKAFSGEMLITSRPQSNTWWKDYIKDAMNEDMNHSLFNKTFFVECKDALLARYILSPRLMERMLSLREYAGVPYDLYFKNSLLFIRIEGKRNMFEYDIEVQSAGEHKSVKIGSFETDFNLTFGPGKVDSSKVKIGPEDFESYYQDFESIVNLLDVLRQNVRIWRA